MILAIVFTIISQAAIFVDDKGFALYETIEGCLKKASICYETDKDFDKDYYVLQNGKYVKDAALEATVKAARKTKEDAVKNQESEIKTLLAKLKSQDLSTAEVSKVLRYLLKGLEKP